MKKMQYQYQAGMSLFLRFDLSTNWYAQKLIPAQHWCKLQTEIINANILSCPESNMILWQLGSPCLMNYVPFHCSQHCAVLMDFVFHVSLLMSCRIQRLPRKMNTLHKLNGWVTKVSKPQNKKNKIVTPCSQIAKDITLFINKVINM